MYVVGSELIEYVCSDGLLRKIEEEELGTSSDPRTLATALFHQQMRAEVITSKILKSIFLNTERVH